MPFSNTVVQRARTGVIIVIARAVELPRGMDCALASDYRDSRLRQHGRSTIVPDRASRYHT